MSSSAMASLNIQIQQDQKYHGDDWWSWSIWIEGDDDQLDQIEKVVYQLHRSFPDPVRIVTNRKNKFKLTSAGWGVFTIHARVITHDGAACKLVHELELRYEDGRMTTA